MQFTLDKITSSTFLHFRESFLADWSYPCQCESELRICEIFIADIIGDRMFCIRGEFCHDIVYFSLDEYTLSFCERSRWVYFSCVADFSKSSGGEHREKIKDKMSQKNPPRFLGEDLECYFSFTTKNLSEWRGNLLGNDSLREHILEYSDFVEKSIFYNGITVPIRSANVSLLRMSSGQERVYSTSAGRTLSL